MEELRSATTQIDPFIVLGKPDLGLAEEKAVIDVMRSGWLGNGPVARTLEAEFASFFKVTNPRLSALATNSCTMGLMLALRCAKVGEGDEVITSPLTFAATVNAIIRVGATPVFVDVDGDGCLDPSQINEATTEKTKAIIPIHLAGSPCDMDEILERANFYKMTVIEDAAHGFGGHFKGEPLGTIGHYGVFSFYPTKNLASGDGGMVVCDALSNVRRMRMWASQGLTNGAWMRYGTGPIKTYQVQDDGYKGLISDVHAAIALAQLRRWDELKAKRSRIFDIYEKAFGKKKEGHSKHLYTVRVDDRTKVQKRLHDIGIGTGVHYNPLHLEPAYASLRYRKGDFPVAEEIGQTTMSLPLHTKMTPAEAERVVNAVINVTN